MFKAWGLERGSKGFSRIRGLKGLGDQGDCHRRACSEIDCCFGDFPITIAAADDLQDIPETLAKYPSGAFVVKVQLPLKACLRSFRGSNPCLPARP